MPHLNDIPYDAEFPFVLLREYPSLGSVVLGRATCLLEAVQAASVEVLYQRCFEKDLHVVQTCKDGGVKLVA